MTAALRILAATLAVFLVQPASAQIYAFGGFGPANIKTDAGDATSGSITAGLGYQANRHFAVEASVTDFGASSIYSGTRAGPGTAQVEGGSGLGLAAVGTWPLTQTVRLLAKVGAQDLGGRWTGTRAAPSVSNLGWTVAAGAGVQVEVAQKVGVRALLEHVDGRDGVERIRLLNISAVFSF